MKLKLKQKHVDWVVYSCFILLLLFIGYLAVASVRYRILHPEKTQTQLMIDLLDILMWK